MGSIPYMSSPRITEVGMSNDILYSIEKNLDSLTTDQNELSSGKIFSLPSDNPEAFSHASVLQTSIDANNQYVRNNQMVDDWVKTTSSQLDTAQNILDRARTLAVQAANSDLSPTDMQAIGQEVYQLRESLRQVANTQVDGRYIFGGQGTQTAPYGATPPPPAPPGAITVYTQAANPAGGLTVELTPNNVITYNITGQQAFGDATLTTGPNASAFAVLDNLYNDLMTNNITNVSNDIGNIDGAKNRITNVNSTVGALQNRVEDTAGQLTNMQTSLQGLLSQTQDADMAKVITQLNTQENIYKASLAAGAQAIQPSLLDYLH